MAYTFKIKLEGSSKPPIWRKVRVNSTLNFDDFHIVIQAVFDWNNSHMYQFSPKGYSSYPNIRYQYDDGIEDYYTLSDVESFPYGDYYDAEKILLRDYFTTTGQKMIYIYDFGDDWKHSIVLEKADDAILLRPQCWG